jgi:hypothetical protein
MIISFEINGNLFTYKTAEFMLSSSKTVSGELSDLKRAQGDGNYAKYDEKISLRYKDGQNPVVYVIKDYFDNYDTLVGLLGKEEN